MSEQPNERPLHPGEPTAEELAADENLYPQATGDDVADGSQLPGPDVAEDVEDVDHGEETV